MSAILRTTSLADKLEARPRRVLSLCALMLAVQVGPWWYSSIDSTAYLSMARSLARGSGLTNLGSPLWWYSPGYAIVISPLFWLAARPFFLIGIVQWLLAVGLMLGVYRWARRAMPEAALWLAVLTVVNHGLWIHFRRPLSEMAFMCGLIWAINVLDGLRGDLRRTSFAARLGLAAALVAVLCVVRPVGIMLAPAFAVWVLIECGRRITRLRAAAAVLVVALAAATPVAMFVAHERTLAARLGGRSYADDFQAAADSPLGSYSRGAQLCISDVGRVAIPGFFKSHGRPGDWTDPNMLVHLPFFVLLSCGWWRWLRLGGDLYAWYAPFYLLLIAAHAMDTGARLLLPLLPPIFACLWLSLARLGRRRQTIAMACVVLQVLVGGSYWLAVDMPRAQRLDGQWPAVDELAARIRAAPGPVAAKDLPTDLLLMVELAIDRPVATESLAAVAPRWIVTAQGEAPAPKPFVAHYSAGGLTLWR